MLDPIGMDWSNTGEDLPGGPLEIEEEYDPTEEPFTGADWGSEVES